MATEMTKTTRTATRRRGLFLIKPPRRHAEQSWPTRGRTMVLWGVAAFVACQVGLRLVIDLWGPQWRDPTFEIKASQFRAALDRCPDRKLIVAAFGSSATGHAFN